MANLIYTNRENVMTFLPASQGGTVTFELDSLASGAGVQSAQHDLGESARSGWYEWRAFVQFATTPVLGETVDFYLKTAGNSGGATVHPDNDDGTTAGAVSAENKLRNLHYVGSIEVDEAAANVEMAASGIVYIPFRAFQVVAWNDTADALTSDETENGFHLSPIPDEIQ